MPRKYKVPILLHRKRDVPVCLYCGRCVYRIEEGYSSKAEVYWHSKCEEESVAKSKGVKRGLTNRKRRIECLEKHLKPKEKPLKPDLYKEADWRSF